MTMWPHSGNAGLIAASQSLPDDRDRDDFDELTIGFAEAFGVSIEQPSERERTLHRAARKDAHPMQADGRQTTHGRNP